MSQNRWTEQEIADLIRMYPDKSITLLELVQHFGRRKGTIKQQARRQGLRRPNREWSEQDVVDIARMYTDEDVSREQMIAHFGCTWRVICHQASALKLRRPHPNTRQVQRDYFNTIDTDEKAYWLGFIAADGTVVSNSRQYSIVLDLQPRDMHWLERFRDTIAPGAKITSHGSRSSSVSIGSQEMVRDVMALGIGPRKSNTLEWPSIPEALVIPFLLGYFDGDGSFTPRSGRSGYQWILLGTFDFLWVARECIQQHVGVALKEPVRAHKQTSPHLYRISANGPRAPIIDHILNASGLGMPRKRLPPQED
jgi:hypothetical protein